MSLFASSYDIIFFGIIAFSAILAFVRGGIIEILSLSSWFIAIWALHKFGKFITQFIPGSISNDLLRSVIAFVVIFLLVAIAMALLKKLLANFITTIGLGGLNYAIGIGFGIVRGVFICSLLIIVVQTLNLDSSKLYTQSKLYPVLSPVINYLADAILHSVKDIPKPPSNIMELYK